MIPEVSVSQSVVLVLQDARSRKWGSLPVEWRHEVRCPGFLPQLGSAECRFVARLIFWAGGSMQVRVSTPVVKVSCVQSCRFLVTVLSLVRDEWWFPEGFGVQIPQCRKRQLLVLALNGVFRREKNLALRSHPLWFIHLNISRVVRICGDACDRRFASCRWQFCVQFILSVRKLSMNRSWGNSWSVCFFLTVWYTWGCVRTCNHHFSEVELGFSGRSSFLTCEKYRKCLKQFLWNLYWLPRPVFSGRFMVRRVFSGSLNLSSSALCGTHP